MRDMSRGLVSYLFTFLELLCGLVLLIPFGWIVLLFCMLSEPESTVLGHHLKRRCNLKRY